MTMYKQISLLLGAGLLSTLVSAQNLYMNDMKLKSDLDWLNAQGVIQISTSTWPLTSNEIKRALATATIANQTQQQVVASVQSTLNDYGRDGVTATVDAYVQTDREALPQNFADDKMAGQEVILGLGLSEQDWEFNLKARVKNDDLIDDSTVDFDGSYLAGTAFNQWLIAGKIPAWWGPGHEGSLIRGDATRPVTGFTMQRDEQTAPTSKYLSWVGPWQYQLFAGQLEDYTSAPDANLFGMRLTANPWPWLEASASRTFIWGGEGQPRSLDSFVDALTGLRDNGDTGKEDPANQLAGFDLKANLASLINKPIGVYATYVGEDEAGGLPSKKMYLAGADYASQINNMPYQLYAEYADTRTNGRVRNISYNHSIYKDGYYQQGYPLGHPLGGDAESVSVGGKLWVSPEDFVTAKLQYAKVNQADNDINQAFPTTDKLKVVDVTWSHQWQPQALINTRLWAVDSDVNSTDIGAGVGLELTYR